jgi:hypothetical protein
MREEGESFGDVTHGERARTSVPVSLFKLKRCAPRRAHGMGGSCGLYSMGLEIFHSSYCPSLGNGSVSNEPLPASYTALIIVRIVHLKIA